MSKVMITESYLEDIADAIRTKNGSSDTYKPAEMADAIEDIPGGITPSGTISIATNGTVDVTQYASASVAVPNPSTGTKQISITQNGTTTENVTDYANAEITVNVSGGASNEDAILDGSISGAYSNSTVTSLRQQALSNNNNLTSVSFPAVTSIGNNALYNCQNIESISLPLLANANAQYALAGIKKTPTIVLPSLTSAIGNFFFNGSTLLATADLGAVTSLGGQAFVGTAISTLILRRTSVCALSNMNCFNNTPFASGGAGGILYVPNNLISSYQSASNWSTILGYANNQIKKIEGTIYETKYADGTTIPTS